MILTQLLLLPLLGALIIALIPVNEITVKEAQAKQNDKSVSLNFIIKTENNNRTELIKKISLVTTLLTFLLSLYL
jgi:hypothetical protein